MDLLWFIKLFFFSIKGVSEIEDNDIMQIQTPSKALSPDFCYVIYV